MDEILILRVNNRDYFFNILKEKSFYSVYRDNISYFIRILLRINNIKLIFNYSFLYNDWAKNIKKYERVVIFDYGYNKQITTYIKKKNPQAKINVFCFNKIFNENNAKYLRDKNIDKVYSFDPEDCEKYGLEYNSAMYTNKMRIVEQNENIEFDVVFVGAAKTRKDLITNTRNKLNELGMKTDFRIITDRKDYLSYDEYVELIKKSKAILDITLEGQKGLTLRFMEGLFLSKKIITNNPEVKKYDFYKKENFFILGEDNMEKIKEFLDSPYEKVDEEIINYYDFDEWLKRFL